MRVEIVFSFGILNVRQFTAFAHHQDITDANVAVNPSTFVESN